MQSRQEEGSGWIGALSDEQRLAMGAHVDRWIAHGLRTGPAERGRFEAALRRCYEFAQVPWPGRVIWVRSPPVLALAAAMADGQPLQAGREEVLEATLKAGPVREAVGGVLAQLGELPEGGCVSQVLHRELSDRVAQAITRRVEVTVCDAVDRGIRSPVSRATSGLVGGLVMNAVEAVVREVLRDESLLPRFERGWHGHTFWQMWGDSLTGGAACTSFFREVCGLSLPEDFDARALAWEEAAQCTWWCYAHRHFVLACEHPREVHLEPTPIVDMRGRRSHRLHHLSGPALSWSDGWKVYAIHGRLVPGRVVEHPETLTVQDIEQEENAEVRREMIARYGWTRFITDCGAQVVDALPLDHPIEGLRGARLLSRRLPGELEPIVYLEMRNSTADPDGSHRRYLERIDPKAYNGDAGRLCHAAMASRWFYRDAQGQLQRTFPDWRAYQPAAES